MTPHTEAATAKPFLADTRVFRSLVAAIVAAMMMLTGWTAAQASVVNDVLDGNGPQHPSIRQLERPPQSEDEQHQSIRQVERAEQARAEWLARMEFNELRRFRNRAPSSALPALDAAIAQLESQLAGN